MPCSGKKQQMKVHSLLIWTWNRNWNCLRQHRLITCRPLQTLFEKLPALINRTDSLLPKSTLIRTWSSQSSFWPRNAISITAWSTCSTRLIPISYIWAGIFSWKTTRIASYRFHGQHRILIPYFLYLQYLQPLHIEPGTLSAKNSLSSSSSKFDFLTSLSS